MSLWTFCFLATMLEPDIKVNVTAHSKLYLIIALLGLYDGEVIRIQILMIIIVIDLQQQTVGAYTTNR